MLASIAKPMFVAACAANLAFSVMGAFALGAPHTASSLVATIGGGLSFVVAAAMALTVLQHPDGFDRPWIKAALVFLVLGPLAFWGLQIPAEAEITSSAESAAMTARAAADVFQSQLAMIAVALAAVFCAARSMTAMLDDLAV